MAEYNQFGFRIVGEETREKMRLAKLGNQNRAKPYPAFVHRVTGEVIPAGFNLTRVCREMGLVAAGMRAVKDGRAKQYKGWVLAEGGE